MPLSSDTLRDARIVVIGAGAIGASISYRLAQAGAHVTTIERRFPGGGTTGNSFAWLNSFNKTPRDYHRLNMMSLRDHQDLADELDGTWLHLDGGIHWASEDEPAKLATLRQNVRRLREWGTRVETTTPEIAMREQAPDLWIDPDSVPEVYLSPREGWLETVAFAHGVIHGAITRYGASLERASVVGLRGPGGAISSVVLDDGRELEADVVVNAAGPDAAHVGALAGVEVAQQRQIGMLVTTAPAPVCLKHVVRTHEVHIRPDGGGRLMVTNDRLDSYAVEGRATRLDAPEVQDAVERARRVLPSLADVPPEAVRIGMRAMPRDGHSILGFEPAAPGLYTAVTHSGITLAARVGQLVLEDLLGTEPPELAALRPTRFAEQSRMVVAATEE
jgi:glycine/D-amino acid oxidase-like deaminating enzyme